MLYQPAGHTAEEGDPQPGITGPADVEVPGLVRRGEVDEFVGRVAVPDHRVDRHRSLCGQLHHRRHDLRSGRVDLLFTLAMAAIVLRGGLEGERRPGDDVHDQEVAADRLGVGERELDGAGEESERSTPTRTVDTDEFPSGRRWCTERRGNGRRCHFRG